MHSLWVLQMRDLIPVAKVDVAQGKIHTEKPSVLPTLPSSMQVDPSEAVYSRYQMRA